MFGKMEFRVLTQHHQEAAVNVTNLLRREGFKVYDLRESEIVSNSDGSKISCVYILCCKGSRSSYERLKNKYQYTEIIYEGYKTLM